jgi:hypothetical protein
MSFNNTFITDLQTLVVPSSSIVQQVTWVICNKTLRVSLLSHVGVSSFYTAFIFCIIFEMQNYFVSF